MHRYLRRHDLPYHPPWREGYVSIGDVHTTRPLGAGLTEERTRFFGVKRERGPHQDARAGRQPAAATAVEEDPMKPSPPTLVLTALLIATNLFWLHETVDAGLTLTYLEAGAELARRTSEHLLVLANLDLVGAGADEALATIAAHPAGLEPFEKSGCLFVGEVCLRLDAARTVVAIELP